MSKKVSPELSRRDLLAGASLAALPAGALTLADASKPVRAAARERGSVPTAPFDSLRDWVAAMDDLGLVMRFDRVDQDAYETTALVFANNDRNGYMGSPVLVFDEVKIDGKWVKGPVIANPQGHWASDTLIWGLETDPADPYGGYRRAKAYMQEMMAENDGGFPALDPVEVSPGSAPVKEVVLTGDDVDLTRYPFIKTNPYDAGRYVNTGSVFMWDPDLGGNFGTYRCQLKGPRLLGVNPEPNQTGHKMLNWARERGEKVAKVSIVVGQDPVVWMISGTRVAGRRGNDPVDELALAGGMRGKPIDVVKCETNDMMIPAHAEMVIEGEVPLDQPGLPEGPFGEMYGFMGPFKEENFWMNVTAVTHRKDPWIQNAYTGMQRGMVTAPMEVMYENLLRTKVPQIREYHQPQDTMGIVYVTVEKDAPGQGMAAAMTIAEANPVAKVVIALDSDVNIYSRQEALRGFISSYQPWGNTELIEEVWGIITDPSQPEQGKTSKLAVDATRQWPEEGGRKDDFPMSNRAHLMKGAPDAFANVLEKYGEQIDTWSWRNKGRFA